MRFTLALILLPMPLSADVFSTDYETIFEKNYDQVERFESFERLKLPERIILTRFTDGRITAFDMSEIGPAGCNVAIAISVLATSLTCPKALPQSSFQKISKILEDNAEFFSRNNIPRRKTNEVWDGFQSLISEQVADWENYAEPFCRQLEQTKVLSKTTEWLLSDHAIARHKISMGIDRLPLFQPCSYDQMVRRPQ